MSNDQFSEFSKAQQHLDDLIKGIRGTVETVKQGSTDKDVLKALRGYASELRKAAAELKIQDDLFYSTEMANIEMEQAEVQEARRKLAQYENILNDNNSFPREISEAVEGINRLVAEYNLL